MNQRLSNINPSNNFWKYIDKHYPDERVKKIYPNMKFKAVGLEKKQMKEQVQRNIVEKADYGNLLSGYVGIIDRFDSLHLQIV